MVIGTAKNIPTIPKTQPQKMSEKKITKGESPSSLPINLGSIILLIEILIIKYKIIKIIVVFKSALTSDKSIAGIDAMIEPTTGTKLKSIAITPHKIG